MTKVREIKDKKLEDVSGAGMGICADPDLICDPGAPGHDSNKVELDTIDDDGANQDLNPN